MRFLVCDDDATVRKVVAEVVRASGHDVVAEAASSLEAIDCLDRLEVEGVVVDLSLRYGSGTEILDAAARRGSAAVVFTSFGDTVEAATLPGRPPIVAKPDFAALEEAITAAADADETADRRRAAPAADVVRLPALVDEPHVFYDVLGRALPGDVLLAVSLPDPNDVERAALANAVRSLVRVQDRIMRTQAGVIVLLVGAGPAGATSVEDRIAAGWADRGGRPVAVVTTTIAEDELPADAFTRLRRLRDGAEPLAS